MRTRILHILTKYLAYLQRLNVQLIRYKLKKAQIHSSVVFGQHSTFNLQNQSNLVIEENVLFRNYCNILVFNIGSLKISKNVFFNNYCSINCLENIEIGENTLFGESVKIYDHNHKHGYNNGQLIIERDSFKTAAVKIGKNCWFGSNVTILKGVEIGDNVIIGAGCLIYQSIPANSIVRLNQNLLTELR